MPKIRYRPIVDAYDLMKSCEFKIFSDKNCRFGMITNILESNVTWRDLVTWPAMTWSQIFDKLDNFCSNSYTKFGNSVALRAAIFPLFWKNLGGRNDPNLARVIVWIYQIELKA